MAKKNCVKSFHIAFQVYNLQDIETEAVNKWRNIPSYIITFQFSEKRQKKNSRKSICSNEKQNTQINMQSNANSLLKPCNTTL